MAVRVRVRVERLRSKARQALETVAVANSGFEAAQPELLLPVKAAARLGLWPAPPRAAKDRFVSPAGEVRLLTVERAVRVALVGSRHFVIANAIVAEREEEVVMNDWLVDRLGLQLTAPGRGLYRVGARGRKRRSEEPETW